MALSRLNKPLRKFISAYLDFDVRDCRTYRQLSQHPREVSKLLNLESRIYFLLSYTYCCIPSLPKNRLPRDRSQWLGTRNHAI